MRRERLLQESNPCLVLFRDEPLHEQFEDLERRAVGRRGGGRCLDAHQPPCDPIVQHEQIAQRRAIGRLLLHAAGVEPDATRVEDNLPAAHAKGTHDDVARRHDLSDADQAGIAERGVRRQIHLRERAHALGTRQRRQAHGAQRVADEHGRRLAQPEAVRVTVGGLERHDDDAGRPGRHLRARGRSEPAHRQCRAHRGEAFHDATSVARAHGIPQLCELEITGLATRGAALDDANPAVESVLGKQPVDQALVEAAERRLDGFANLAENRRPDLDRGAFPVERGTSPGCQGTPRAPHDSPYATPIACAESAAASDSSAAVPSPRRRRPTRPPARRPDA